MKLFSLFAGVFVGVALCLGSGTSRAHASDLLPHTSFDQQASIMENSPVVEVQEGKMFEDEDLMLLGLFCVLIFIGISLIGRGSLDPDPDDDQSGPRRNGRSPARRTRGGRPIDDHPSIPRARRRGERIDGAYLEDMDYGPSTGGGGWLDAFIGPSGGGDHGFNGGGGDFGGGGADGSFDGGSDGGGGE